MGAPAASFLDKVRYNIVSVCGTSGLLHVHNSRGLVPRQVQTQVHVRVPGGGVLLPDRDGKGQEGSRGEYLGLHENVKGAPYSHEGLFYGLSQNVGAGTSQVLIQNISTFGMMNHDAMAFGTATGTKKKNNNNLPTSINTSNPPRRNAAPEPLTALAASADGGYVAGGAASGRIYIWLQRSGALLVSFTAHVGEHAVTALAFCGAEHDLLLSGGADASVRVFRLCDVFDSMVKQRTSALTVGNMAPRVMKPFRHLMGHTLPLCAALGDVRAGEVVVTAAADRSVRVWHIGSGQCLHTWVTRSAPRCLTLTLGVSPWSTSSGSIFIGLVDGAVMRVGLFGGNVSKGKKEKKKMKKRKKSDNTTSTGNMEDDSILIHAPSSTTVSQPSHLDLGPEVKKYTPNRKMIGYGNKRSGNTVIETTFTVGVASLALSPLHDELVVGYDDGVIRVYDLTTSSSCAQVHTYTKHAPGSPVSFVATFPTARPRVADVARVNNINGKNVGGLMGYVVSKYQHQQHQHAAKRHLPPPLARPGTAAQEGNVPDLLPVGPRNAVDSVQTTAGRFISQAVGTTFNEHAFANVMQTNREEGISVPAHAVERHRAANEQYATADNGNGMDTEEGGNGVAEEEGAGEQEEADQEGGEGGGERPAKKVRLTKRHEEDPIVIGLQERVRYLEKYAEDLQNASKMLMQTHTFTE